MSSKPIVAVVSGANRGIGLGICQILSTFDKPIVIYAASRAGKDLGFQGDRHVQFEYPQLDISSPASVKQLANTIQQTHKELDVLINNAGLNIMIDGSDDRPTQAKLDIFNTNYRGTLTMCQTFLPIMKEGGRIVNVSSVASSLSSYSEDLKKHLRQAKSLSDIEKLAGEWETAAKKGKETELGYPNQPYSVSKAFINSMTIVLARDNPNITINSCCPGWCSSDMGKLVGSNPPKSLVDGAKIPCRLAFKDIGGVTGHYWSNDSVSSTGEAKIQAW